MLPILVSESTPKHKKRRKKKNKIQGQLDSAKASSSVVSMDIIAADKSENCCTDVVGASGHADINMDPINGDDLSSAQSKANDADVLLKNKDGNKGDKNCAENSVLLQESSARRKDGGEKESGVQPVEDQASLLIMEAWLLSIACILQQTMVLAAYVLHV